MQRVKVRLADKPKYLDMVGFLIPESSRSRLLLRLRIFMFQGKESGIE